MLLKLSTCLFALLFIITYAVQANFTPRAGWMTYKEVRGSPYKVGYDKRSILINNKRVMLLAGVVHYPRSTPATWKDIFQKALDEGLNTIQTYVFWNIHEKKKGHPYNYEFNADLLQFLETAKQVGLFVNLRIGPYVCAEWNYGGLPVWLNNVPGIQFRTYNKPWMDEMKKFVTNIVKKVEPYLARNGGPIILAQIENEYRGNQQYVQWCGDLAESLKIDVPWIMCNGDSANNTINTCNSCNCVDDGYVTRHATQFPNQPLMFTENEGWFQNWGQVIGVRSAENLAYSVAAWIAAGGSYHAYYMWHGGNHFQLGAASGITNMYADDVNLHSDGTLNEPKYTHLGRLHKLVAKYADKLLEQDIATPQHLPWWNVDHWDNGTQQFAYTYAKDSPNEITFIYSSANIPVGTLYKETNYSMSPRSVVVVNYAGQILYNTSHITGASELKSMRPVPVVKDLAWSFWSEPTGVSQPIVAGKKIPVLINKTPIEQLNVTEDDTARLWYRANVTVSGSGHIHLVVQTRKANSLLVFYDGQLKGVWNEPSHAQGNIDATLDFTGNTGTRLLEILSVSLGLDNGVWAGGFEHKGIVGKVILNGVDITSNNWIHQKGLAGEVLQLNTAAGRKLVQWNTNWQVAKNKEITWYQATFDLPKEVVDNAVTNPVLVNAQGLQRGHLYINEFDIGIYWTISGACTGRVPCCELDRTKCDQPTQLLYFVPPDVLKQNANVITVIEELGAPNIGSVQIMRKE
jgi:beta-galactosidase